MPITHAFTSAKSDDADATLVRPSDWNAAHLGELGQTPAYPTSFAGDSEDMSSTSNWADVSAFDTKEILDGTILHLLTTGASKDNRVRKTLGTTRAGAFDYRFGGVVFGATHWGAQFDTYFEMALKTSADATVALLRIQADNSISGTQVFGVGGSSLATQSTISRAPIPRGVVWKLRVTRDGSNNLLFWYGISAAPSGMVEVQLTSNNTAYTVSSSGTVARVEFSIHTPSGPSAGQHRCHAFVDYFYDAS